MAEFLYPVTGTGACLLIADVCPQARVEVATTAATECSWTA